MDKDGAVTISQWNKGQVKHPIYGFGLLKNVEVFENKGIAKLKNRATQDTITVDQLPIACQKDQYGNVYILTGATGTGSLYKNGTEIMANYANMWDTVIYKDYIWIAHSTVISCYGPLSSGSAQLFNNVGTGLNGSFNGKMIVGQDDTVYVGNGNNVASFTVLTSGTVGVAPTISLNLSALDLPEGQYVTTFEEYGRNLMIGTQGGQNYFDRGNQRTARIYPWDRVSASVNLPIIFSENGINAIKQHANKLYVSAGTQGNVYVTDSTQYAKIATLPYTRTGVFYSSTVYSNAMSVSSQGTLLIGLTTGYTSDVRAGIYEIDIADSSYPVAYKTPSSFTSDQSIAYVGFIFAQDYQTVLSGWSINSTYGVDTTDFCMYPNYGGVIESPLIQVGRYNAKKTFEHIEWDLADPLVSGQNIRISYRGNSKDNYTVIGTWGYSTVGAIPSFEDVCAVADLEYIQVKIELDQSLTTVYGSNVNLISVKLW